MSTKSKIDAAIAAAQSAKRDEKEKPVKERVQKPKGTGRVKLTDEERAERKQKLDAERAERKQKREQERAEKQAKKAAERPSAHMKKIQKAFAALPKLSEDALTEFNTITATLAADQVGALAQHLLHFNRVNATERARDVKIEVGDTVKIVGGDARWVGKVGTVDQAAKIRCFVNFEIENSKGELVNKRVYLFTSDVEKVESREGEVTETSEATGTDE